MKQPKHVKRASFRQADSLRRQLEKIQSEMDAMEEAADLSIYNIWIKMDHILSMHAYESEQEKQQLRKLKRKVIFQVAETYHLIEKSRDPVKEHTHVSIPRDSITQIIEDGNPDNWWGIMSLLGMLTFLEYLKTQNDPDTSAEEIAARLGITPQRVRKLCKILLQIKAVRSLPKGVKK